MPLVRQKQGYLLICKREEEKLFFIVCSKKKNLPISHKVNVPLGMDNDAQNISDLFSAFLLAHVVLSQNHTVHISRPVRHLL